MGFLKIKYTTQHIIFIQYVIGWKDIILYVQILKNMNVHNLLILNFT